MDSKVPFRGEKPNKETNINRRDVALPTLRELVQIFSRDMPKMLSHYCTREGTKIYLELRTNKTV